MDISEVQQIQYGIMTLHTRKRIFLHLMFQLLMEKSMKHGQKERNVIFMHQVLKQMLIALNHWNHQKQKNYLDLYPIQKKWVNVEKKLPQYYNLLIGKIEDPEEEKKIKVSFLTYCYYCLNVQVAQSNKRIDIGKTYFLDWLSENT